MEQLQFQLTGHKTPPAFTPILVGVVGSGNLEVMIEPLADSAQCRVDVITSAQGFSPIWAAVMQDFQERHGLAGIAISINDMGATPAVVSLRLDQAAAALPVTKKAKP
ncbi:MAG: malonate decarboxylase acyl carrier protein [Rhodoferax sp.]|uniref:malonate decarboxylase acyl carrier protein n=1 Tax=Rhodoferax sp. TaxID=50421 RepID=UPI0030159906